MPLGLGTALWAVIVPKETTNIITNPSFEQGSTGWSVLGGGATIGTTSYKQAYGAWSLQVNHTITSEGAFYNAGTPAAGSYTISAQVNGTSGHRYRLLAETAGGVPLGAGSITSPGGWQSLVVPFGLPSGTGLNVVVRHIDAANGTFYVDGVQLESGTNVTTYIDGDQPGGTWTGNPHTSMTTRTSQYRGGGTIIALADLGLQVDQMVGAGVPPIEVSTQSFAVVDGAEFQRQRAAQRKFTLTAKPISGTALADFHVTRRTLYDALKPDIVAPQQPIRFLYVGGQGTQYVDAYYASGLELGNMDGPIAESAGVSFIATDPYWYSPTQQGTTLAAYNVFGSANYIVKRNTLGGWGTLGPSGTSTNGTVYSIAFSQGSIVYLGGTFTTAGGTTSPHIAQYDPVANTFGTLAGGGTVGGAYVQTMTVAPSGSVFFGGDLAGPIGGTATKNIAFWNTSGFGTLTNGTVDDVAQSLVWFAGTLFAGGRFATAGGTAARFVAEWVNGAWGTLTNGTVNNQVRALDIGLNNVLYIGGIFTTVAGSAIKYVAQWNGTMLPAGSGADGGGAEVDALTIGPDGRVYVAGLFGTAGGGAGFNGIAAFNGIQYAALGTNGANVYLSLAVEPTTNMLYAGASGTTSFEPYLTNLFRWNGAARLPVDIRLTPIAGDPDITAISFAPDNTLYIGGWFAGSALTGAVGTIVNSGRAAAYPVVRMRLTTGTARVYRIANTLTNAEIDFNLVLQAGETTTLNLQPGNRSFTSSYRGNIFNTIIPGSNLATWSLLPGTNWVSFFADNASLETALFWQVRGWSIDSGTIT